MYLFTSGGSIRIWDLSTDQTGKAFMPSSWPKDGGDGWKLKGQKCVGAQKETPQDVPWRYADDFEL